MAQEACGFGTPTTSTRHMRQLPAMDSRSWKQKRGISAPAASHACSSVYSGGTSISVPSTMSLVISVQNHPNEKYRGKAEAGSHIEPRKQRQGAPELCHAHLAVL